MGTLIGHTKTTMIIPTKGTACRASRITDILPSGAWKGKTCFLIGGGPSLKDFDFNLIKNELTIGINKSFTKFSTTINYAMDMRFYDMVTYAQNSTWKEAHQQWLAYKGIKLFMRNSGKFKFDSSVYVVNNIDKKVLSFDLAKGIWPGNNSGFGALQLAVALGCSRIGLLGYDLKVQENQKKIKTHWHEGYGFEGVKSFQSKLNKFKMCFEEFSSVILQQNIEVVNLNPDSALKCFPFDTIGNFLK